MSPQPDTESKSGVQSSHEDREELVVSKGPTPVMSVSSSPDIRGGVVALGKFDALHTGHRSLAERAATMGTPVLLSFSGMGEVLGWKARLPVAALCDHKRIMSIWAEKCGGVSPKEYSLEFIKVRSLSPRDFVQKLATELHVKGVVAGVDYRFGYRAAGTATDLVNLCSEYGLQSFIVDQVMDKDEAVSSMSKELTGCSREKGQVSSTRIRKALELGDMVRVTHLLGRKHRLVLKLEECRKETDKLLFPLSSALNQYPREGLYECVLIGSGKQLGATASGEHAVADDGQKAHDEFIATAEVKIGPTWIEIPLINTDIEKVLQRTLLGVEFSYG